MKSVTLVLATSTGGVGAHVLSLVRGLTADGWRVHVCGPQATDDLFGFSGAGAEFTPISGRPFDPAAARTVRRVAGSSGVMHAHGLRAATIAGLARRHPLVVTWHNAVLEEPGARRRLLAAGERYVAKSADIALCASSDLEDRVRALGVRDVRPGPVGLRLPEAQRFPSEVRAALGVDGAPLLLSVGRLHPQKAHDVFIRAVARLRSNCPEVRAVIAGDGPLRPALEGLIAELDAPVTLLGRRSDVSDLLRAADVVVCTSVWEARALSVQEALLAGRPVVATRVGGLPGLVGEAGVLVPPEDVDALAAALDKIVSDRSWAATLAARSAEAGRRLPTEHDTVAQVEAVYRELLGASR